MSYGHNYAFGQVGYTLGQILSYLRIVGGLCDMGGRILFGQVGYTLGGSRRVTASLSLVNIVGEFLYEW